VGVDAPSVDPVGSSDFAVHRLLLGSGKILVENLRGLEGLPEGRFTFSCLPLAIAGGDGSPVRAAAWF
jgi:kynurenine formamidase